tara:strand:- start:6750 stop:7217 length:468 start_codon:yes stop_codon:yes gene_type:complete
MILISHRGNIDRVIRRRENTEDYIQEAIDLGYDVEIDVWFINFKYYLGHDGPDNEVEIEWLLARRNNLWIHCKNFEALSGLMNTSLKLFYHQKEDYTIISDKHIWAHATRFDDKCIIPLIDMESVNSFNFSKKINCYGICSDFIKQIKVKINEKN